MKEKKNSLWMSTLVVCLLLAALLTSWSKSAYARPLMAATRTRTSTPLPTRTPVPTITQTRTPTTPPTPAPPFCSPVTSIIVAPFVRDGGGMFCWQISVVPHHIVSWNTTDLTINGVDLTNLYVLTASLPPQIGGNWYISYASGSFGHFEAK